VTCADEVFGKCSDVPLTAELDIAEVAERTGMTASALRFYCRCPKSAARMSEVLCRR
jgi:hypothetical protein